MRTPSVIEETVTVDAVVIIMTNANCLRHHSSNNRWMTDVHHGKGTRMYLPGLVLTEAKRLPARHLQPLPPLRRPPLQCLRHHFQLL
jgi:hypothetical protein